MPEIKQVNDSIGLARFCAKIADEKLAKNVVLLDLSDIEFAPSNYFVIVTGETNNQIKAITDNIIDKCIENEIPKPKVEGLDETAKPIRSVNQKPSAI